MATIEHVTTDIRRTDQVLTVSPGDTVERAAEAMRDHRVGSLVAVDSDGALVGILTERDVISRVIATAGDPACTRVQEAMTTDVVTCGPGTSIVEVERLMVKHGIRHLPIVDGGKPVGMVSSRDVVARQLVTITAMKTAAEQVARMFKELKNLELEGVVELITRELPRLFGAQRSVLCLPRRTGRGEDRMTAYRSQCPCSERVLLEEGGFEDVAGQQVTFGQTPACCRQRGGSCRRLVIPLRIVSAFGSAGADRPARTGFLCVCGLSNRAAESGELTLYKAHLLRDILNTNLTNAQLYEEARHSLIDPLTRAGSRRLFEERLEAEFERAVRHERIFCIAIVDVDHFKTVNDECGHIAGDQVLRDLAECMRQETRASDVVARYGGDEFVVLMPETTLEEAAAVAERLRSGAESIRAGKDGTYLTVSCGLAQWSGRCEEIGTSVLRRADAALYEAKRTGRNHVVADQPAPVAV